MGDDEPEDSDDEDSEDSDEDSDDEDSEDSDDYDDRWSENWYGEGRIAENGDHYGRDNDGDGRTESTHVRGYFKDDGTYYRGHYRAGAGDR